jgi:hypothetical protein
MPPLQACAVPQALPQPPQCALLVEVSTHVPSHEV